MRRCGPVPARAVPTPSFRDVLREEAETRRLAVEADAATPAPGGGDLDATQLLAVRRAVVRRRFAALLVGYRPEERAALTAQLDGWLAAERIDGPALAALAAALEPPIGGSNA